MKQITFFVAILLIVFAGCKSGKKSSVNEQSKVTLTGAGATFPLPYYNLAIKTYQTEQPTVITYGGIGSGGGIRSMKDQIVDFGGTDAFLSDDEMKEMPKEVIHIPTCMGAVVVSYNLEGISELKLNSEVISAIYFGKIKNWNDRRIQALNPDVKFPDLEISPVYRSDGSGTTFVFSDYMTKSNEEWANNIGTGKSLKWPTGIAAKGNPGVAGVIQQTKGAIGYMGSEYAFALNTPVAAIANLSGNYVLPNNTTISAAAQGIESADTRTMITNSVVSTAYPISCFTWILVYKEQNYNNRTSAQATETVRFLNWMLGDEAQGLTQKVHYSPLPNDLIAKAKMLLQQITYQGKPIILE